MIIKSIGIFYRLNMTPDQIILLCILTGSLILFASNIIRYDIVASLALLVTVFLGIIPFKNTFVGFSHSAVITVAAVFVISRAVENTGALSVIADYLKLKRKNIPLQLGVICIAVSLLSALINNVGAVALIIPITLKVARIKNIPRGIMLMPLAFSSLMGGLITLIGTPPNIIISDFRRYNLGAGYYFFDFSPVGLGISLVGVLFISLIGWKLIPLSRTTDDDKLKKEHFTVELKVKSNSSLINNKVSHIMNEYEGKFNLIALVREGEIIRENLNYYSVNSGDGIILEADKWTVSELVNQYKLLIETGSSESKTASDHFLTVITALPQSLLCEKPIKNLNLIETYGIEIIAVSRRDKTITERISELTLKPGDTLLIKSDQEITHDKLDALNCIVIEEKHIRPFSKSLSIKVLLLFGLALIAIMTGKVRADVAFFACAVALVIGKTISLKKAYASINLPIIILIGTLIPVGEAMEATGTAKLIAQMMYQYGQILPVSVNLFLLILVSMLLSNVINNAAVAVIFSPIALQMAKDWQVFPDPFLMAVAVGASCAFLTPIGHQSNTLVLGPGNYKFSDYWLLGLPLSLIVAVSATALILLFWPFQ